MSDIKTVDIKGLLDVYEFPCKLPSGQELKISPVTTGQMKKILAYENETDPFVIEEALDQLITDCVVTEGFDIKDLYLQDRFYLLMEIRKVTKGASYGFKIKCPKCAVDIVKSVKLDELPFVEYTDIKGDIDINDRLKFKFDYPTRGNQIEAIEYVRTLDITSMSERMAEIVIATFASCITEVVSGGEVVDVPLSDRVYVLNNIVQDKFTEFKTFFVDNDFGVSFKVDITCPFCRNKDEMEIPLSDFFA